MMGGQLSDHSNTPIVDDGIGISARGYEVYPKSGIVIFLDVLGIKRMWQELQPIEIVNNWKKVIRSFMHVVQERPINAGYFFRVLSDTIIITIPSELNPSIINRTFDLLLEPFIESIKTRMLLRGVVSHGRYYLSQQLIIGPAVDDAASHHAKLDWIGIAISPNVSTRVNNIVNNSVIYYHDIPLKNLHYPGVALNWPNFDSNGQCYRILQEEKIKADASSKVKYDNTLKFYNEVGVQP